jgi:phosphoribosylformylglycinamidine (FGAM) synthase-like enzyme
MHKSIERDPFLALAAMIQINPTWRAQCVEAGARVQGLSGRNLVELLGAGLAAADELMADQEMDPRRRALYEEIAEGAATLARSLGRLGAQFVSVSP